MSGSDLSLQAYNAELPPVSPEDYAKVRQSLFESMRQTPNAIASMPLTIIAPDPKLPFPASYIPGAGLVEATGGLLHDAGTKAANVINSAIQPGSLAERWGLHIPDPPQVMADMGQRFEENRAEVSGGLDKYTGGILKQPDLTTPEGLAADTWGSAIGAGVGALPASLISAVPRGLKTITSLMLAPREHMARNIPINLGLTGGQELSDAVFHPDNKSAQTATPPAASTVLTPTPPPPPPVNNDPLGLLGGDKQGGSDLQVKLPFDDKAPGPTFTQQGDVDPLWLNKVVPGAGSVAESIVDLGLIFGAIAAGHALYRRGAAMTSAGRAARLNDPNFAAQVNDYQNDVIKRGPGSGTIGSDQPVDAPLPQGGAVRKTFVYLADKMANDAAKNQDFIRMSADNPTPGERLASQLGNMYDTRMQQNQVLHFVDTGEDWQTRIKIPSVTQLANDYAALPVDKRVPIGEALRARNEIQNRANNAAAFGPGAAITDIRHDFIGKPTSELHDMVDRVRTDPDWLDISTRYKGVTDGMIDIGNHPVYKFFDNNEARDLRTLRSYIVPEFDVNGQLKHPFGPRDASAATGQAHGGVDPIYALAAHVEQMYPLFHLEQLKQQLYAHYTRVMREPGAPEFMTEVESPRGIHASYYPQGGIHDFGGETRDPIVTLRNNGIKHIRVDNPDLYNVMKGNSIGAMRVHLDALDLGRRVYQKGTTGLISTLTGRAMPLRNAAFTSWMSPVNTPSGFKGGLLSSVAPKGFSTFARGLDMPLNVARLPFTAVQHMSDRIAGGMAELLHPQADNIFNRNLRSIMDPALVDTMAQSAKARYDASVVKFARERGIIGQSAPLHTEAPGIKSGTKATQVGGRTFNRQAGTRLETARIAPRAFISGTWAHKEAKIIGIHLHNILGDIFNSISDLGHEQWLRTNFDYPDKDRLAYEARNLVGNPARTGSGVWMGGLRSALPYTNVSVQGIGRSLRAFGSSRSTPIAYAIGLGSAAMLTILTHMRSAAHLDYLQNQLSLQQREANVELALNDDPLKPTVIPLPQEARAAYAYMLDLMSKAVNIIGGRHDPDVFKSIWDGISHFFGSNITRSNMWAIVHGAVDAGDFLNVPPYLGRVDWNAVIHGKSLLDAYHSIAAGASNPAPGQGYDAPLDSANGQLFERILSNTIGAVANVMEIPNSAIRYYHQGHSFLESMGMAGHDWLQTSKESNPMLNNMLWETQVRLSINPPIAEAMQPALAAIKKLTPPVSPGLEGFVGQGAANQLPVPMTEDKQYSNDLLMRQMLVVARGFGSKIDQAMQPIRAIQAQMHSVEKAGMDPAERRTWLNDRTRDMADKYKLVDAYVNDLDNAMSNMAGKPVRIEDIDFKKDSSQFR